MKTRLMILLSLYVCSISAADRARLAKSQALHVDAPVAGYAAFGSSQIRALIGIPGLVRWSEPLALEGSYTRLSIAPGELYAVGVSETQDVVFLGLDAGQASVIARLKTDLASIDDVVFSPSGTAAALRSATGQVAVLTSLPGTPQVAETWDGAGGLMALSDDGELSVVEDGTRRLRARGGGTVLGLDGLSAAAFFPRSQRLLMVSGSGSVAFVENGAVQAVLTSPEAAGVRQAMISDSGRAAFLATAERLWTLDFESVSMKAELVEPNSAALHRTRVRGRVLLVDEASGEAQLVSAGAEALQVDMLRIPVELGK